MFKQLQCLWHPPTPTRTQKISAGTSLLDPTVYCPVHILKFLPGVCVEKRLCNFEAKGQEFVTFSRHCCCSREITIIWMHFIMLCIFRALFCYNANPQLYYSLHGLKFFKETKRNKTDQQKASRIQLGPAWWLLSFQQDRTANLAHPAALFCPALVCPL